jgi:hypothetical protein
MGPPRPPSEAVAAAAEAGDAEQQQQQQQQGVAGVGSMGPPRRPDGRWMTVEDLVGPPRPSSEAAAEGAAAADDVGAVEGEGCVSVPHSHCAVDVRGFCWEGNACSSSSSNSNC